MSCNRRSLHNRVHFPSTAALPLCLILSACGGGGEGSRVASTPPPPSTPAPTPTPTPTATSIEVQRNWLPSPATRVGAYGMIGRLTLTPGDGAPTSYRAVAPGEFTVSTTQPNAAFQYTLNAGAGLLPAGLMSLTISEPVISWDFNPGGPNYRYDNPYGDEPQYFGQNLKEYDVYSDGTKVLREDYDYSRGISTRTQPLTAERNLTTTLFYDVGYSYVAMGEWSWRVVDLNGTAAGDYGNLLFVHGDRTPETGIPTSGTATYDARTLALLSSTGRPGIPFTLTADFGQRLMSTRIDQDYRYNAADPAGDPILGIHVSGTAPFNNNGSFDIPLSGSANYANINTQLTPPAEPVTGTMNGAFFGPHAEQVGGVFALGRPDGTLLVQDAFVGERPQP